MKSAAQYILLDYGTQPFTRAIKLSDTDSLFSIMEDYADGEVKAFKNDLKQFAKANPKATIEQMLEHFNI